MPAVFAFGQTQELTANQMREAPVRFPRPERLQAPLTFPHAKAQEAGEALGLRTVGALLDHLPRGTGEARTVPELVPDEVATVLVEVKSITSRPVRRRGMKPLVEATVGDASGVMKATFFNQPWLQRAYPPGTRLMLQGKYQARNRFRVNRHAPTEEVAAVGDAVAEYPATKGITSTQILALVQEHRPAAFDEPERLPARLRAQERLPDAPAAYLAAHFGDHERGRRRLAFEELLLDQLVQLRMRAERRSEKTATPLADPATLSATWQQEQLPFTLTQDQQKAIEEVDQDIAKELPMQRLLMGEVGSGKTV